MFVGVESFARKTIFGHCRDKHVRALMMTSHFFTTHSESTGTMDFHDPTSVDFVVDNDELLKTVSMTTQMLLRTPPPSRDQRYRVESSGAQDYKAPKVYEERTLYDILGTTPSATKDELKRQYIKMAKTTHPDAMISRRKGDPNIFAPCDFSEIASAYRVLSNPLERKRYDRTLQSARSIVLLTLLGEVFIGTTLTVAEISSTILLVALTVLIQPLTVRFANDPFIAGQLDSNKRAYDA